MPPPLTIADLQESARQKGGRFLSPSYSTLGAKYEWECAQGHRWFATGSNVRTAGKWCKWCAGRASHDLAFLQAHAESKGGSCESATYANMGAKYDWKCGAGHSWSASGSSIIHGKTWCPHCAGNARKTLEDMKVVAAERGGRFLTAMYTNMHSSCEWECAVGHVWMAKPADIIHGEHWCPHCAGNAKKDLGYLKDYAACHDGECLSTTYTNMRTDHLWKCADGHTWWATPSNVVLGGKWCRQCQLKSQKKAQQIMERLTGEVFECNKHGLLSNPLWELDGWCEKLRVAFEYHGVQHYRLVPFFHRNGPEDLMRRQKTDAAKAQDCDDRWITLITIPYDTDPETYIAKELWQLGCMKTAE